MGFAGENPKRIRISNIDPKFRRRKRSLGKSILMEREVKDFVDSILATNTRKSYIRSLSIFEEYMEKTISDIIRQRREDFRNEDFTQRRNLERQVEKFYVWLVNERKLSQNTAYSYVTAIKSIMSYYDVSLKIKGITRVPTSPRDWIPSVDELRRLFEASDMREKTLLALAVNVPMRINDYNEILKSDVIPYLDATEYPVSFMKVTRKSKAPMPCFITEETMKLLRTYVKNLRDDNPYLWQGRGEKKLNEDSINRTLKNLVKTAGINTLGLRVRFHLFRKTFIGVARSMIGLSDDQVKMLTGKKVKADMDPYYVKVELMPLFERVADKLRLTGYAEANDGRIDNLENFANLMGKVLAEALLLPAIRKLWREQQKTAGDTVQFITVPNFDAMTPKELLELYLQLKKQQKGSTKPDEPSTLVDALEDEMARRQRKNLFPQR
jgi:integrase